MFIVGPRFVVMSPEFKRWLKQPKEWKMYDLAESVNCTIKKQYIFGVERAFYSIVLPNGLYYYRGKTQRSRYIFDVAEACKMLKRIEKDMA